MLSCQFFVMASKWTDLKSTNFCKQNCCQFTIQSQDWNKYNIFPPLKWREVQLPFYCSILGRIANSLHVTCVTLHGNCSRNRHILHYYHRTFILLSWWSHQHWPVRYFYSFLTYSRKNVWLYTFGLFINKITKLQSMICVI